MEPADSEEAEGTIEVRRILWTLLFYVVFSEILGNFVAPQVYAETMRLNSQNSARGTLEGAPYLRADVPAKATRMVQREGRQSTQRRSSRATPFMPAQLTHHLIAVVLAVQTNPGTAGLPKVRIRDYIPALVT